MEAQVDTVTVRPARRVEDRGELDVVVGLVLFRIRGIADGKGIKSDKSNRIQYNNTRMSHMNIGTETRMNT